MPRARVPDLPLPLGALVWGIVDVVLDGGQRGSRRNAWDAVCSDRMHARAREEAWVEIDAVSRMAGATHGEEASSAS
ncbi:MAG: hypothetical protein ACRDPK_12185 [Carbonactinosporaceae bacterium]